MCFHEYYVAISALLLASMLNAVHLLAQTAVIGLLTLSDLHMCTHSQWNFNFLHEVYVSFSDMLRSP